MLLFRVLVFMAGVCNKIVLHVKIILCYTKGV